MYYIYTYHIKYGVETWTKKRKQKNILDAFDLVLEANAKHSVEREPTNVSIIQEFEISAIGICIMLLLFI